MRITELEITNFKALTRFSIEDLGDAIVLAGPNGSGKSCVLDGIRLLKSAYAGYSPNEWHYWMGEFQINFQQRPQELARLLQDTSRDLRIAARFTFAPEEITFIRDHADELVREAVWREVVPELAGWRAFGTTSFASQYRAHNPEVERRTAEGVAEIHAELEGNSFPAEILVGPTGIGRTEASSRVLETAFSSYDPGSIGIMDFHGSDRQYNREQVAGINLDLTSAKEQRRQSALYNMPGKYAGLKTEMATEFVRRRLAIEAGAEDEGAEDLVASLQDLFKTFFPGKSFAGPQPTADGRVVFPVMLADGSSHDLDDLSAGEKEVLYGYMRLRSSAPQNSVILVDEPELHLNPRLIRGLARFYYNHVVAPSGNQLWLISHSDTLLRDAVNFEGFEVYHLRGGDRARPDENQARRIRAGDELERLVIELVGDLAAYRPGAKVVLFEGGGDVEFDVRMVSQLFPEFDAAVNAIAAGSKRQVGALYETLERVGVQTLGARFYAIRDRDSGPTADQEETRLYSWDAYHIENYLLEPEFVFRAVRELSQADHSLSDPDAIEVALKDCAAETVGSLVRHRIVTEVYGALEGALSVGGDPNAEDVAPSVARSVEGAAERVATLASGDLVLDRLTEREAVVREELLGHLESDEWRRTFRGREVLARFAGLYVRGVGYEGFRDLVLARMREAQHRPVGMERVLDEILRDEFP
jgi:AAA domain, putative AbiEii toxin, Type IV TA system